MLYSTNRTLKLTLIALVQGVLLSGCATPQAKGPAFTAAAEKMMPHFECALLYDQLDLRELVSKGIDEAATIGEQDGLSPSQIMSAYSDAKKQANALVLEKAIAIAAENPNRIARLDGTAPPPAPEDEIQAWKEVYGSECPDADTAAPS